MPKTRNRSGKREAEPTDPQRPKGEWIKVEAVDEQGRQIIPPELVAATAGIRFNPKEHTDLDLRIFPGMAPQGGLVGQYKIYELSKFSMKGWRIAAKLSVELPPTRGYEEKWFEAFDKRKAVISHPGLPDTVSEEFITRVVESGFHKKEIHRFSTSRTPQRPTKVYEGSLEMRETWKSALLRRKGQAVSYLVTTSVGALIGSLITGLLWWASP